MHSRYQDEFHLRIVGCWFTLGLVIITLSMLRCKSIEIKPSVEFFIPLFSIASLHGSWAIGWPRKPFGSTRRYLLAKMKSQIRFRLCPSGPTSAMKSNEIEHLHATGWVKVAALSNIKVISDSSSCSSSTHHHAEYPLNCD